MTGDISKGSGTGPISAEERVLKIELLDQLEATIKSEGWTQTEAAKRLDISQLDVSRLLAGHVRQFSVARLLRCLTAIGQDVEIIVSPKVGRLARVRVRRGRRVQS
jgi:predicted XRE-type DNA-binding protein